MQAKIYQMFPLSGSNMAVTGSCSQLNVPELTSFLQNFCFPLELNGNRLEVLPEVLMNHIHNLADQTLMTFGNTGRGFLDSMEKVLKMYYRYSLANPGNVVFLQEILDDETEASEVVYSGLKSLNEKVLKVLKDQAAKEGILENAGSMEDLIFFMLDQVLRVYLTELGGVCTAVYSNPAGKIPSEKDMLNRFYSPIASQLKALLAS